MIVPGGLKYWFVNLVKVSSIPEPGSGNNSVEIVQAITESTKKYGR